MSDKVFFSGGVPVQSSMPRTWDAAPLQEGLDQWRYIRRGELAQLAVPFVVAQLRDPEQLLPEESWKASGRSDGDKEIVRRAVSLARMLQDEVDRARPRS